MVAHLLHEVVTLGRLLDVLHGAPLHLLPPVVVVEGLGSGELEGAEAPLAALGQLHHVSPHRVTELHPGEGVELPGHVHGVLHQVLVLQEEIPEHLSMSKD